MNRVPQGSRLRTHGVVLLTRSLGVGGAERQLATLAAALHREGVRTRVVTFYDDHGTLATELRSTGVPVVSLRKRGRWDAGFIPRLLLLLRRERPCVLHPYLVEPNWIAALLKPFMPGVRLVWGVRASNMEFAHYGRMSQASFHVSRRLARFADLVIANSQAGRAFHVAHGYPAERTIVIPNGIDTEKFRPMPERSAQFRRELGLADGDKLVGIVGRMDVMKDHATFLRAAAHTARRDRDVRFLCMGAGPAAHVGSLQRLAAELGLADRVLWAGARPDIATVYGACQVVVSSSAFGEGFPNVVAEAMACGVPCAVTDVGDSARVVGTTGRVVPPAHPAALAAAIDALLEPQPGDNGCRERIESEFSVDHLTARSIDALLHLCP